MLYGQGTGADALNDTRFVDRALVPPGTHSVGFRLKGSAEMEGELMGLRVCRDRYVRGNLQALKDFRFGVQPEADGHRAAVRKRR